MSIPPATYVSELDPTRPDGAIDPVAHGDDYLRRLHAVLRNTFPALNGPVLATPAQLNQLANPLGLSERFLERTAGLPTAWVPSETEAFEGLRNDKVMTPLRTRQVLDGRFVAGTFKIPVVVSLPPEAPEGAVVWLAGQQAVRVGTGGSWIQLRQAETVFSSEVSYTDTNDGQLVSASHGLGGLPAGWRVTLVCKAAEQGYVVGDEVDAATVRTSDGNVGANTFANSSQIGVVFRMRPRLLKKNSPFDSFTLTTNSWRVKFYAWR